MRGLADTDTTRSVSVGGAFTSLRFRAPGKSLHRDSVSKPVLWPARRSAPPCISGSKSFINAGGAGRAVGSSIIAGSGAYYACKLAAISSTALTAALTTAGAFSGLLLYARYWIRGYWFDRPVHSECRSHRKRWC